MLSIFIHFAIMVLCAFAPQVGFAADLKSMPCEELTPYQAKLKLALQKIETRLKKPIAADKRTKFENLRTKFQFDETAVESEMLTRCN